MKIVKIKIASGLEIYINTDNVAYFRVDPVNDKLTQIHMNNKDAHMVIMSLEESLKLLQGNSR